MTPGSVGQITDKEAAEFVRLLYWTGRVDERQITDWADTVVGKYRQPPAWSIELSMSGDRRREELDSALEMVPGEIRDDLPRKMFACQLRHEWLSGAITDHTFTRGWYTLYPEYPEDVSSKHAADVWQYLDEVLVSIHSGDQVAISLEQARSELKRLLEPYEVFAPLVRPFAQLFDV